MATPVVETDIVLEPGNVLTAVGLKLTLDPLGVHSPDDQARRSVIRPSIKCS